MIVIVGSPAWRPSEPAGPAGGTCRLALAAAARGASVEVVGRVGDDRAGDALVLALARAGVGHAAVLRDPTRPTPLVHAIVPGDEGEPGSLGADVEVADDTRAGPPMSGAKVAAGVAAAQAQAQADPPRLEVADVALGLSYLTSFAVLVVADDAPAEVVPACVDGAAFAGAQLVVLVPEDAAPPGVPASATVLAAPVADDGAFAAMAGAYVAGLDAGRTPADAFRAAIAAAGWEASPEDEPA